MKIQTYSPLPENEVARQYQQLAEQIETYAIFLLDTEGRITTWNRGAVKMKQYEPDEAVGRYFGFLYPEDERKRKRPADNLDKARRNGRHEEEAWHVRKDGSLFWAQTVITALHDDAGELCGFAKVTLDLTWRKELEDHLRARQKETERILAAADAGTWKWDTLTNRVEVSPHFLHLLGFDANQVGVTLNDWLQIIHPDDKRRLYKRMMEILMQRPQQPLIAEIRLRTADGSYRWFYARADWHRNSETEPYQLLGVNVDLHELRTAVEERERLFHELEAERLRFREILEQMPSGVVVAEVPSGQIIYGNAEASQLLGSALAGNRQGQHVGSFGIFNPDGQAIGPEDMPIIRAMQKGEVIKAEEIICRRPDGVSVTLSVNAAPIHDEDGVTRTAVSVFHDVQLLKNAQSLLAAEKERAQITLKVLTDAVIIVDAAGNLDYLNPAAERMTGWKLPAAKGVLAASVLDFKEENTGTSLQYIVDRCLHDAQPLACTQHGTVRDRDGRQFSVEAAIAPIHLPRGELIGAVLVLHDVTEPRNLLRTLAYQASHDALTGLINRREFEVRLSRTLSHAQNGVGTGALLYLDLDQFKIVNDTCGHAAGDEMLQQLSRVYQSVVRERDTFARLGGDEFALILEHCTVEEAVRVANKVLEKTTCFKYRYGGKSFRVGVSIGVVPITESAVSIEQTMRLADHACYIAKENGRNRIYVHRDNDIDVARRQHDMHWVSRLNEALRSDQLDLFYQPIVPIAGDHGLLHYEILLRMKNPDGNHIGPGIFLPAAERYDLMPAVDRWVLKKVLEWLESQPEHVERLDMCTINLSRRTLADESFQLYAIECLENCSIPPKKLCFEITENGAIANLNRTIKFIETLKERGCRFSLDDFGTGMTSFSYLKMLPVDFIKIDGSFVTMMKDSAVDREMVKFTNEISHIMGRQTIAEYVGDEVTYQDLEALNIDYAQGYWIGEPQPLAAGIMG